MESHDKVYYPEIHADTPLVRKWRDWDAKNPRFWPLFVRFTNELMRANARRGSAWLVVNRVRWESMVRWENGKADYKIPNDYIALYARRFMEDYPAHDGYFQVKRMVRA